MLPRQQKGARINIKIFHKMAPQTQMHETKKMLPLKMFEYTPSHDG